MDTEISGPSRAGGVQRRRMLLVTTVAGCFLVVLGAVAFACTFHAGSMWFCDQDQQDCSNPETTADPLFDADDPSNVNSEHTFDQGDGTFFSKGSGATPGATFELKYVPVEAYGQEEVDNVQPPYVAATCHGSGAPFLDSDSGAPVLVEGGSWGPEEVDMPPATGTYVACARQVVPHPEGLPQAADAPGHVAFTIE